MMARLGRSMIAIVCLAALFSVAGGPVRAATSGLDRAIAQAQRLALPAGTVVIAAAASQEGHWTFANVRGERFTASSAAEVARVPDVLAPELKSPGATLALVLTEESAFAPAEVLALLPREVGLRLSTETGVYPMVRARPVQVALSPRLKVEIGDRAGFDEILSLLDRSVARGGIRIVALLPGAAASLPRRPAVEARKGDLVEAVDPPRLAAVLAGMRGQTVLVTGRIDGRFLQFQVAGAADRGVIIEDLAAAAAANDVNLVLLDAPPGRQPGVRNWLWQRAELAGADTLHPDSGLDALIGLLATDARPLVVKVLARDDHRVTVLARPEVPPSTIGGIGDALSKVASDLSGTVTGRIEPRSVVMHLVSARRSKDLDGRLVPWLPAWVTWGYLGLMMLGAIGSRASWRWWSRLWPPERAAEYAGGAGLAAAKLVRAAAFVLIFMPAVAMVAVPAAATGALRRPRAP